MFSMILLAALHFPRHKGPEKWAVQVCAANGNVGSVWRFKIDKKHVLYSDANALNGDLFATVPDLERQLNSGELDGGIYVCEFIGPHDEKQNPPKKGDSLQKVVAGGE